jgi:hypothetical protein
MVVVVYVKNILKTMVVVVLVKISQNNGGSGVSKKHLKTMVVVIDVKNMLKQ